MTSARLREKVRASATKSATRAEAAIAKAPCRIDVLKAMSACCNRLARILVYPGRLRDRRSLMRVLRRRLSALTTKAGGSDAGMDARRERSYRCCAALPHRKRPKQAGKSQSGRP